MLTQIPTVVSLSDGRLRIPGPFGKNFIRLNALEQRRFSKTYPPVCTATNSPYNRDILVSLGYSFDFVTETEIKRELVSIDRFSVKTQPLEHQFECLSHFAEFPYFALFADMGLGKTKILIDNAAYLYMQKEITQVLVFAPNGVHRQWIEDEIPKHCSVATQLHLWEKEFQTDIMLKTRELKFVSVNSEAVQREKSPILKKLIAYLKAGPTMMILDESQYFKSRDSIRTAAILDLGKFAKYRRIASGTPFPNGLIDAYSQYKFLSPEILGMDTVTVFKNRYCEEQASHFRPGRGVKQITGYKNRDEFEARVAKYTYRKSKSECVDLPPKTYAVDYVTHGKEWKRLYRDLVEGILRPKDPLTLNNALAKLTKLRQLTGGFDDEALISEAKLLKLEELSSQYDGRMVVWSCFTAEIKEIASRLKCNMIMGEVKAEDRLDIIKDFLANPDGRIVMNPQAGGTGFNIDGPELVVYYSNSFNYGHRAQSEDRTHRLTTRGTVLYRDLIVPGTVDVRIRTALMNKEVLSTETLESIRALFLENS